MSERRRATRLALPKGSVSGIRGSGRILDVSSTGVRLEVDTRCVFARGEHHRLVLSDLLASVEIEGQVRWTRSNWRDSALPDKSEYFQTAGIAFSRLLSDEPAGIWSGLLAGMTRPAVAREPEPAAVPKAHKQKPTLKMIEPIDGCTVSQQSIKVICTIERPETITGFRINGVDAFVMGDLGTVDLKLQKGANRIVSIVSRRDGTYSTFLLGKVFRSQDH